MTFTNSNVPKDARALKPFDLVKGYDSTTFRCDHKVNSEGSVAFDIIPGEPVRTLESSADESSAYKCDPTGLTYGKIVGYVGDRCLGISHDGFDSAHIDGFPGANMRGSISVLQGQFACAYLCEDWFATLAEVTDNSNYPTGTHDHLIVDAITTHPYHIGREVVVVKTRTGRCKFMAISSDPALRHVNPAAPTGGEKHIGDCVVGRIIRTFTSKVYGTDKDYVEILFNL